MLLAKKWSNAVAKSTRLPGGEKIHGYAIFFHSFRIRNDFYLVWCLRFLWCYANSPPSSSSLMSTEHAYYPINIYSLTHKNDIHNIRYSTRRIRIIMNIYISRSTPIKSCHIICILDTLNETNYVQIISLNIEMLLWKPIHCFCVPIKFAFYRWILHLRYRLLQV